MYGCCSRGLGLRNVYTHRWEDRGVTGPTGPCLLLFWRHPPTEVSLFPPAGQVRKLTHSVAAKAGSGGTAVAQRAMGLFFLETGWSVWPRWKTGNSVEGAGEGRARQGWGCQQAAPACALQKRSGKMVTHRHWAGPPWSFPQMALLIASRY